MKDQLFYCGKPVESMSKEELIEALKESYEFSLKQHKNFQEMSDIAMMEKK